MDNFELTPQDYLAIQQMIYGESASEDIDTMKMIGQSAINRLKSGRSREFGKTVPEILKKGYYAVSKGNVPYKQALSGKFPNLPSQTKWGLAKKALDIIMKDQDFGEHQFYFKPEEVSKLQKSKGFDFTKVKPKGTVGQYQLYGY